MAIPDATHKSACDAVVSIGNWVSVHSTAAGTSGTNEATGGSYARQQSTFATGAMSGGYWVRTGSAVNVPVAAGTYAEAGLWSASSTGTFVGSDAFVGGSVTVSGTGASITITPSVQA
ncbi:hypothetical protein R2325_16465 [Mycobacteroides chelonae]|uniref:hypothetical protein n=1 Tax=Mycobacteroides TaxID=670516 RepID=UPI00092BDC14|nr:MULTISPECIES: hypothetical protein [Mycobacteroides]MBV6360447.1 hypothetical protein [Mycobacteroides chelonae]MEC4857169.1 hypothetical protein [Mycobacteroides chelonae]MEC4873578.1 hypothetical protein [Mycobacteroides chelonae]SHW93826.1 Uncharacterised protein [Mycobacteroides abscessus subsp. abscessus]SKL80527.1 Uncharacterised protein [Mycobacteroides abscessus subsp. abscessus]